MPDSRERHLCSIPPIRRDESADWRPGAPVSVLEAGLFAFLFRCHSRILRPGCCCGADRLALFTPSCERSFEGLAPILVEERPDFFLISDFKFLISVFRPPDCSPPCALVNVAGHRTSCAALARVLVARVAHAT